MNDSKPTNSNYTRLKILVALFGIGGVALFVYFISQVGLGEIWEGVGKVGFGGFLLIFSIYGTRLALRALAWSLSVETPYVLKFRDSFQAVVVGEAMGSLIPLGIVVSGTSKALAVRHRLPLVASLSALAVENLFYSFATGLFIVAGAGVLILNFDLPEIWLWASATLISLVLVLTIGGFVMVVRQWHFASAIAQWLYRKRIFYRWLKTGRSDVKIFENRIYGFYRRQPKRFMPIFLLQVIFHSLGVLEVWLILSFLGGVLPAFFSAFLLESVSRIIVVTFKLVPFMLGVEEAGAQFIIDALELGGGLGVTLAIVRKGVRFTWATLGILVIVKRGLSIREVFRQRDALGEDDEHLLRQAN